jgi:hypothetical protein
MKPRASPASPELLRKSFRKSLSGRLWKAIVSKIAMSSQFISPSGWIEGVSRKNPLDGRRTHCIPLVELTWNIHQEFRIDRRTCSEHRLGESQIINKEVVPQGHRERREHADGENISEQQYQILSAQLSRAKTASRAPGETLCSRQHLLMSCSAEVNIMFRIGESSFFVHDEDRIMNYSPVTPFSMFNRTVQYFPGIVAIPDVDGPSVPALRQLTLLHTADRTTHGNATSISAETNTGL